MESPTDKVEAPRSQDLRDALEHAREGYPEEISPEADLKDFRLRYLGRLPVEALWDYDDLGSWMEDLETPEDLDSFRGKDWASRAQKWGDRPPPVIVVTGKNFSVLGDGRGRTTYAAFRGIPLDVWEMQLMSTKDSGPADILREFISETLVGVLEEGIIPQSETREDDYRGLHRAPGKGSGDPLWNVSQQVYPEDFYTLPMATAARYYGSGESGDMSMVFNIRKYHNKPNAKVKVYRAVPESLDKTRDREIEKLEGHLKTILKRGKIPMGWKSYDQISSELDRLKAKRDSLGDTSSSGGLTKTINPGDWVTLGISYARQHGESALRGRYVILSRTVKAKDLYTDGNSLYEWGWDP